MARKQDVFGVTIDGDISGLKRAMYEAEALFKSTEKSLKYVQKQAELEPTNTGVLMKQMHMYKKAVDDAYGAVNNLQGKLDLLKEQAKKLNLLDTVRYKTEFNQIETEIKLMMKTAEGLEKKYKSLGSVPMQIFEAKLKKFYTSFTDSFAMFDRLKDSLKDFDDILKLDPTNTEVFTQRQQTLDALYAHSQVTLIRYREELENIRKAYGYSPEVEMRPEVVALRKEIELLVNEGEKAKKLNISHEAYLFNENLKSTSNSLIDIANATTGLSRIFRGFLTSSFEAAKTYESSIANIKRVISDLSESSIDNLKTMAVETGTAFTEIADYATIAGSLGLAGEEVDNFTKAMIDLNTATGGVFNGEEGAKGIAVFLKQMGLGTDEAENFGSAVVEIGRKYADIGDETVNVATRMTALSAVIKTNQYELLGLAGVMADLGLSADTNANAINRAFLQIDKILAGGVKNADEKLAMLANTAGMTSKQFREAWGQNAMNAFLMFVDGLKSSVFNEVNASIEKADGKITKYAETLGWTAEQFERAWGEDSQNVFNMYIDALGELGEEGESASSVLTGIGLSSVFTAQTLLRLAGSGNDVRDAIDLVNEAWNENTALQESAQNIYDTTERKLQGLFESLKQLGGSLVNNFTPMIKDMVDRFTVLSDNLSEMNPAMQKLTTYFLAFGAGLSPVARGLGNLGLWFVKDADGISKFSLAVKGLGTLLSGPVGTIAGVALLGTTLYSLSQVVREGNKYAVFTQEIEKLGEALEKTSQIANENYANSIEGLFDGTDRYIDKITELIEISKDKDLPWSERSEANKKIAEYVSTLNGMLGGEVVAFNSVTGQLTFQQKKIDDLKKAFAEYTFEVKKQNWLDAHQSEYQQAKNDMSTVSADVRDAALEFASSVSDVPAEVTKTFLQIKNASEEGHNALNDLTESLGSKYNTNALRAWAEELEATYKNFENSGGADAIKTLVEFQNAISKYEDVQNSDINTFDELTKNYETVTEKIAENIEGTATSFGELSTAHELLKTFMSEEEETNSKLLEAFQQELEKAPLISEYIDDQVSKFIEGRETVQGIIDDYENWSPSVKDLNLRFNLQGLAVPTWMMPNIPNVGGGGSGGYGNFRENIAQSALNQGIYRSGGVSVSATFNISNGNNIDRYTVRDWGETIGEAINEYLGAQI